MTAGGREVVKINPGARERTISIMDALPATYPPLYPLALPRVLLMMLTRS